MFDTIRTYKYELRNIFSENNFSLESRIIEEKKQFSLRDLAIKKKISEFDRDRDQVIDIRIINNVGQFAISRLGGRGNLDVELSPDKIKIGVAGGVYNNVVAKSIRYLANLAASKWDGKDLKDLRQLLIKYLDTPFPVYGEPTFSYERDKLKDVDGVSTL